MKQKPEGKIRVACTGAGYFSRFQYDAWHRLEGVEVVGAMARSRPSEHDTGAPGFDDLSEMLSRTVPDLLDIITPPPTHLDFITTAIAHGVERIICQKPFCRDLDEAREAVARADEAGVAIVIHENFRFQPWYRVMRAALDEGKLGQTHQMTFRLRTGDGQGRQAYLDRQPYFQKMPRLLVHETAVHWIDTFMYVLADKPNWVQADLRRMNPAIAGEDAGHILFGFANGKRALFDGNRLLDHDAENCRLTLGEALLEGSGGSITLDGDGHVSLRRFGQREKHTLLAPRQWPGFGGDCVYALQAHVIEAIRTGSALENRAEDYILALEIVDAVYRSARTGVRIEV